MNPKDKEALAPFIRRYQDYRSRENNNFENEVKLHGEESDFYSDPLFKEYAKTDDYKSDFKSHQESLKRHQDGLTRHQNDLIREQQGLITEMGSALKNKVSFMDTKNKIGGGDAGNFLDKLKGEAGGFFDKFKGDAGAGGGDFLDKLKGEAGGFFDKFKGGEGAGGGDFLDKLKGGAGDAGNFLDMLKGEAGGFMDKFKDEEGGFLDKLKSRAGGFVDEINKGGTGGAGDASGILSKAGGFKAILTDALIIVGGILLILFGTFGVLVYVKTIKYNEDNPTTPVEITQKALSSRIVTIVFIGIGFGILMNVAVRYIEKLMPKFITKFLCGIGLDICHIFLYFFLAVLGATAIYAIVIIKRIAAESDADKRTKKAERDSDYAYGIIGFLFGYILSIVFNFIMLKFNYEGMKGLLVPGIAMIVIAAFVGAVSSNLFFLWDYLGRKINTYGRNAGIAGVVYTALMISVGIGMIAIAVTSKGV